MLALLALLAQEIDLGPWKLTLPVGRPDEVHALATFESEHFARVPGGLRFRAPVDGKTTKNSSYPRCELRERDAAWSTARGVHTMEIRQSITRLPAKKPHLVAGQIHDAEDDVVMIRLEKRRLFVEGGGRELGLLDDDYRLGTPFTVALTAADGRIRVAYNGEEKVAVDRRADGCYFKAGVYVQSNLKKGDLPGEYGEVVIHALRISHAE
ncbi:MAG TPA: polysaccharide lyase family 7 protein [Planctomycetota bacterium]|nr:polysaccharide lyase family 7 protein [Planctomycetota bacterium]